MTFPIVSLFILRLVIVTGADISPIPTSLALELFSVPAPDQCKVVLEKFSNSSSAFTRCATEYAKPIYMCRNCVHDFINVRTYYYALEHSQSEGINCKDLLTSQDKVEIIKETFEYIVADTGLWAKGFCSSCYTSPLNHTSNLTDNTQAFFALYRTVSDCFEANPDNNSSESRKSQACTECAIDYNNLLTFYKEHFLRDQFPYLDGICFDILDAMNSTQHKWGTGHYHCGRQIRGNFPLIVALIIVLATPIAFYVFVRYGPVTRRVRERVITQRNITNTFTQAQGDVADGPVTRSMSVDSHSQEQDNSEEVIDQAEAGPSTSS